MTRAILVSLLLLNAAAFAAEPSGEYTGSYTANDGSEGNLRTTLKKNADASWNCQLSFSAGDDEITAKNTSCAVESSKLIAEYEADVDSSPLKIHLEGTVGDDNSISGTYTTTGSSGEPAGKGTWKASARP